MILDAHRIPYVATANPSFPEDFVAKAKKAASLKGTRYLHILADCPTGWKHDPSQMVEVGRLATMSHLFPLYEIEEGRLRITWAPSNPVPVEKYLRAQGRFKDLTAEQIEEIQAEVKARWDGLKAREAREKKVVEKEAAPPEASAAPTPHPAAPVSETVYVKPSPPLHFP
jgi:pyruvate/2-oxoacid:ferredoxin oxidoreductase beta subunit